MPIDLEQILKQQEEQRKAQELLMSQLAEHRKRLSEMGSSSQPEAMNLSPEEIASYKKRLTSNLDNRNDALQYLTGLLYKKTIDPTDPLADMIVERTPGQMAKEFKAEDRAGKSKIGNFFRNLDYALGDGAGRDRKIAETIQTQARNGLDNLLKDQGSEIQRAMAAQNVLSLKRGDQNIKATTEAGKLAGDEAKITQQSNLGQLKAFLEAARTQSGIDLNSKRGNVLDQEAALKSKQNQYFVPFGVGQDNAWAAVIENLRKTDPEKAAQMEAKGRENAMFRQAVGNMFKPQGGQTSSTTRPNIHWTKDANGNDVEVRGAPVTSTTTRGGAPAIDPIKFLTGMLSSPSVATTQTTTANPVETLRSAAKTVTQNKATKPQSIVNQALTNTQDANSNAMRASAALNPKISEEDRKDILLGKRYKIDWNPRAAKGFEGTGGGSESRKQQELASNLRNKLDGATSMMMEAAVDGTLDKVFSVGNSLGAKAYRAVDAIAPKNLKGFILGIDGDDTDYELRRMFPGMGQDEKTMQFRTQFKNFMSSLGFDIQKDATGLQALGQEMDRIKTMLPRGTDAPTVALTTMLTMAITKKMEGYLLRKGYTPKDTEVIGTLVGDYVAPRVSSLSNTIKDAKAEYANGKIKDRAQIAKRFKFSDLDPDDIIGAALERKGVPLEALPISIRRLGDTTPTKAEKEADVIPKEAKEESIMDKLKRRYEEERKDKSKWKIVSPPF